MGYTTLKDRLAQAHAKKVVWILQELSRAQLKAAHDNPELWEYTDDIAAEAARRYLAGQK